MKVVEEDIIVRFEKLPVNVPAVVARSSDDCYNVYLNKDLSHEQQQLTLLHELMHVYNSDFDSGKPLELAEGM